MNQLTVRGNYFECGYQVGKRFQKEIGQQLRRGRVTEQTLKHHRQHLQRLYLLCSGKYPSLWQELEGTAQGSRQKIEKILFLNFPELHCHQGCSSIAMVEKNRIQLAHNEDGDRWIRKESCALIKYVLPRNKFYSYVYLGELPGAAYNWNSHGLFFSVNFVYVRKPDLSSLPSYLTARLLMEAKTIEEALLILVRNKNAGGMHYYIGKEKRIISVEQCRGRLSIQEVRGTSFHTNHFIHGPFDREGFPPQNSWRRYLRLQELLPSPHLVKVLFDKKNRPNPLFNREGDKNRTLSTVLFDAVPGRVSIFPRDSLKDRLSFSFRS